MVARRRRQKGSCSFPPVGSPAAGAFKGNDGVGEERVGRLSFGMKSEYLRGNGGPGVGKEQGEEREQYVAGGNLVCRPCLRAFATVLLQKRRLLRLARAPERHPRRRPSQPQGQVDGRGAPAAAASATAVVSEPPRPNVVILPSSSEP